VRQESDVFLINSGIQKAPGLGGQSNRLFFWFQYCISPIVVFRCCSVCLSKSGLVGAKELRAFVSPL
jgi:hypothetical protein